MYKYKIEYKVGDRIRHTLKYLTEPIDLKASNLHEELAEETSKLHYIVNGANHPINILSVEEIK